MVLPTSGTISLENIQTEHGGSDPIGLTEYNRGGAYVADITPNIPVATSASAQISIEDFYGTRESESYTQAMYNINTQYFWNLCGYSSWTSVTPNESWVFAKTTNSYSTSINVPFNNFDITVPSMTIRIRSDNADQGNAADDYSGIKNPGYGIYNSSGGLVTSNRGNAESLNSESTTDVSVSALSATTLSAGTYYLRWIADIYRRNDDAPMVWFDIVSSTASRTASWVSS